MEGGGLAGGLVHVDVRMVQQLVGNYLVIEHDGDPKRSVLDAVTWNDEFPAASTSSTGMSSK